MGNKQTVFTQEQLNAYQDCTFFNRDEIMRIFKRYKELNPEIVPKHMTEGAASQGTIVQHTIHRMPEFKENPFRKRICEVFSDDGSGSLSFDNFLDMFSVFSESSPRELKCAYAFKIYDFDNDNFIGKSDLTRTLNSLTKSDLNEDEADFICERVLEEADLDDDEKISYSEFEHVISRAPDFLTTFHIRI